jgi:hypothetical protein
MEKQRLEKQTVEKQTASQILISLGTMPLLVGILGARAIAATMREMGEASEEIFRGDRLPILRITPDETKE